MRKVIFGILFAVVLMVFLMMVPAASTAANDEVCACEVVDYTQGIQFNGAGVLPIRSILNNALGMPDAAPGPWRNFFSLGFASDNSPSCWMILKFCIPVSGQLTVYECSPTIQDNYPLETANVYVSQNGVEWTYLGIAQNNTSSTSVQHPSTFDLGDLRIQYVKIVDTTDKGLHSGTADAFDIDAVCAEAPAPPECVDPPSSMVSWWPGDGDANDIVDGNTGTLEGGATFDTGKVGDAFSFDGVDDYVEIPSFTFNENGVYSVEFWFYPKATGLQYILDFRVASSDGQAATLAFDYRGNRGIDYAVFGAGVPWPAPGTIALSLNEWHHVGIIHDSVNNRVISYVDGKKDIDETYSWDFTPIASPLKIGIRSGSYTVPTNGLIDEVEIYNRALDPCEIQAIYFAGSAGKCKVAPVIEVDIDIKPGSDPNSINLGDHGLLPVAILGSAEFDVTKIDPATILIGGVSLALRGSQKKGIKLAYSYDSEGEYADMMVFFDVQQLVADLVLDELTDALIITGNLYDEYGGTPIEGSDLVRVIY